MWGEEEEIYDRPEGEAFYDEARARIEMMRQKKFDQHNVPEMPKSKDGKKLKKKIVYVYESDSEGEEGNPHMNERAQSQEPTRSKRQ